MGHMGLGSMVRMVVGSRVRRLGGTVLGSMVVDSMVVGMELGMGKGSRLGGREVGSMAVGMVEGSMVLGIPVGRAGSTAMNKRS